MRGREQRKGEEAAADELSPVHLPVHQFDE
jgi:hypothetical protein